MSTVLTYRFIKDIQTTLKKINYSMLDDFLKVTKIYNMDAFKVIEEYKYNESVILYFDPPYPFSYNDKYKYFDDNIEKDSSILLIKLFDFFKIAKCKIIFVVNEIAIISHLFDPILTVYKIYQKKYQMSGLSEKVKGKLIRNHIVYIKNF